MYLPGVGVGGCTARSWVTDASVSLPCRYQHNETNKKIVQEAAKKRRAREEQPQAAAPAPKSAGDKGELKLLVANLKRKSAAQQAQQQPKHNGKKQKF